MKWAFCSVDTIKKVPSNELVLRSLGELLSTNVNWSYHEVLMSIPSPIESHTQLVLRLLEEAHALVIRLIQIEQKNFISEKSWRADLFTSTKSHRRILTQGAHISGSGTWQGQFSRPVKINNYWEKCSSQFELLETKKIKDTCLRNKTLSFRYLFYLDCIIN